MRAAAPEGTRQPRRNTIQLPKCTLRAALRRTRCADPVYRCADHRAGMTP